MDWNYSLERDTFTFYGPLRGQMVAGVVLESIVDVEIIVRDVAETTGATQADVRFVVQKALARRRTERGGSASVGSPGS